MLKNADVKSDDGSSVVFQILRQTTEVGPGLSSSTCVAFYLFIGVESAGSFHF